MLLNVSVDSLALNSEKGAVGYHVRTDLIDKLLLNEYCLHMLSWDFNVLTFIRSLFSSCVMAFALILATIRWSMCSFLISKDFKCYI